MCSVATCWHTDWLTMCSVRFLAVRVTQSTLIPSFVPMRKSTFWASYCMPTKNTTLPADLPPPRLPDGNLFLATTDACVSLRSSALLPELSVVAEQVHHGTGGGSGEPPVVRGGGGLFAGLFPPWHLCRRSCGTPTLHDGSNIT